MRIGFSLAVFAVGAILKFAVTSHVSGVDLATVGVILMVVGAVAFVLSLALTLMRRRTDVIHQGGYVDAYGSQPYVQPGAAARRTTYIEPSDRP